MEQTGQEYRGKVRLFIAVFFVLVALFSVVNIYFNSYGLFSNYQFQYRKVINDRVAKYNFIDSLTVKPASFVMGSSNSMRFLPETLEEITNLKTFNYGVFHATVEDFWCISNVLTKDLKCEPKLVVFCLDDWNFAEEPAKPDEVFEGAEKRLAFKPEYSKYLDDYAGYKLRWAQLKASLNIDHTKEIYPTMKSEMKKGGFEKAIPHLSETFFNDGVRKKYGTLASTKFVTEEAEKGEFDVTEDLRHTHENWKRFPVTKDGILTGSHEMFEKFSERRLKLFERTVALLKEKNCKVAINLMPLQPFYKKLVQSHTNYDARVVELMQFLNDLQKKYNNIIAVQNNTDLETFGGFEQHFFDNIHPTSVNSDLMIKTLENRLRQHAF